MMMKPEWCASEHNRDMISLGSLCTEPEARDNRPSQILAEDRDMIVFLKISGQFQVQSSTNLQATTQ
eukprot:2714840-Rhodomonas_salina.1